MLQSLRDKIHGWPAKIIFGLLIFVFSFFGIETYFVAHTDTWVAKVGSHEISQQAFQDRLNQLRQQASEQQGDHYDPSQFEKPEAKRRVADSLVDQYLLADTAQDMGMVVTDDDMRQAISAIPAFQVDGKFDPDTYRAVLASNGESPETFQAKMRSDMEIRLLPNAISDSTIVTDQEIDQFLRLRLQTRDLRYAVLPRPALTDTTVTDAQIQDYYKKHIDQFTRPEQVAVNYVELDANDVKVDQQPDDAALKARYEKERNKFVKPEQREVSHILIKVPDNATPAQQKQALQQAQTVDALAKAPGADFAKLAEKYSDDLGSKRQGGDLGWIERGVTNKAFETALFSMKKGQVSEPVLSPEGYHIIWLRDVRTGEVKPFAEVRDELAKEATTEARNKQYSDTASKLTDETYSDPTSLEPAARALNLPVKTTALFSRQGGEGLAANPKVVAAAFSDQVLTQGNNSNPIDLGTNHIVVIHVAQHKPAAPRPLAEVKDQVRQKVLDQRVDDMARKRADELFAQLGKSGDLQKVASDANAPVQTAKGVKRMQGQMPPAVLAAAFQMPPPVGGKPQYKLVSISDSNYALLALDAVHDGDVKSITKQQRDSLRQEMQQLTAAQVTQSFIEALKKKAKVEISEERM